MIESIKEIFLICFIALHALLIVVSFIRAVKGPYISDRIVSINMIGTLTIIIICALTVLLDEGWLADVALVYAIISFLAVIVVTKIYIGVYREKNAAKNQSEKRGEKNG